MAFMPATNDNPGMEILYMLIFIFTLKIGIENLNITCSSSETDAFSCPSSHSQRSSFSSPLVRTEMVPSRTGFHARVHEICAIQKPTECKDKTDSSKFFDSWPEVFVYPMVNTFMRINCHWQGYLFWASPSEHQQWRWYLQNCGYCKTPKVLLRGNKMALFTQGLPSVDVQT